MASKEDSEGGGDGPSRKARVAGVASFVIAVGIVAFTGDLPTLRCEGRQCVVEETFFWIVPTGERRFSIDSVRDVIAPGAWTRPAVHVELDDGSRFIVLRGSVGRAWVYGLEPIQRFVEDPEGELVLESRADGIWLLAIPFVVAGFILLEW